MSRNMEKGDWKDKCFLSKTTTTSMKGVAILLVIIAHIGHIGFGIRVFVPLGCFGVSIFLILSGYGLMESYHRNGLKDFWKKRIIRLLLPYIIWVCFYSVYLLFSHNTVSFDNIRYWFVEYILIWYIAFFFVFNFFPNFKWGLFFVIAILLFWLFPCLQSQQSLSFIIGLFISEYKENVINISPKKLLSIGGGLLFIGLIAFIIRQWVVVANSNIPVVELKDVLVTSSDVDKNSFINKIIQLISKAPIALFLIIILNQIRIDKLKWCYITGLAAYELYLVHMPLYANIQHSVYNLLIFIIEIITFSFLLYKCDNKIINSFKK